MEIRNISTVINSGRRNAQTNTAAGKDACALRQKNRDRMGEILSFVDAYVRKNRRSPNCREIAALFPSGAPPFTITSRP